MKLHPLTFTIYLPSALMAVVRGMLSVLLPLFALRELEASYGLVGIVVAGQSLGMLFMDLPGGMVLERLHGKRTMLVGLIMSTFSGFALSWSNSVPEAVAYLLIMGAGLSLYSLARHAFVAETMNVAERGRAISWLGGANRIGQTIGPILAGVLAAAIGSRLTFMVAGAILGLSWVAVLVYMPQVTLTSMAKPLSLGAYLRQLGRTTRENGRVLSSAGLAQLLAQMVRQARSIIIPLYAADILGLDEVAIGSIMSWMSLLDTSLFYPAGVIMDRFGRKFAIVPSFMLQGICLILIPLTTGYYALLAVACGIGLANGISSGTMMTLGADLAPIDQRGEFLSLWRVVGSSGFSLSPLVAGAIADALTLAPATLVLGATGMLASFIFARFVPETLRKPTNP